MNVNAINDLTSLVLVSGIWKNFFSQTHAILYRILQIDSS